MSIKRITKRIRDNMVGTVDTLTDYTNRMAARLDIVSHQMDRIEAINLSAGVKLGEAIQATRDEAITRNEAITRILAELHSIIVESSEELSEVSQTLAVAKSEVEQGQKLARDSRHDLANVQMLARTGKLYAQRDSDTVTSILTDVELPIYQEALERQQDVRFLELEIAFEAARKTRNG